MEVEFQNSLINIIYPRPEFSTISHKKAFSDEYEDLVPYSLSDSDDEKLLETAFDYLARFIVAKNIDDESLKERSYKNLMAEGTLVHLKKFLGDKGYNILSNKYEKGIELSKNFVNNEEADMENLILFSGYLAVLESIIRTGKLPSNLDQSLLKDTDSEIVDELKKLVFAFEDKFINSGVLKGDSRVVFNPNFNMASMMVGGADADILIDGTLYDFKTTSKNGYRWVDVAEIVGYYILNTIEIRMGGMSIDRSIKEDSIKRVAFYRARYGEIEYIDIEELDKDKIENAIESIRRIFNLNFVC